MNIPRKCFAVLLALFMLVSMAGTVCADENEDTADYVRQILNYYRCYQEAASTDISCLVYALSEIDLPQAQAWASITDYWTYVNTDMPLYPDVLPDGLPQDDSLCIVVLGYQLTSNGKMRDELIGRLETALRSAEKYPNAFIACTGGGTAKNNKSVTEAGEMAKWLQKNGISEERIIIENKSLSTVGNARNTYKILAERYPQVTHLALVTSDYHLPRSSLLFHTQFNLAAYQNDAPLLCVAANAAYPTGRAAESFAAQLSDMAQLTGVSTDNMPAPALSKLDCILVTGSAQCQADEELNLKVMAYYDTGLYRDVTRRASFLGPDPTIAGMQEVTITYREGSTEVSAVAQIDMILPPTEPPTEPPTQPLTEPPTQPATVVPPEPSKTESGSGIGALLADNWLSVAIVTAVLLVLAEVLIIIRLRKIKKLQRAAKAEKEAEKLPDDNSPLEYI